MDGSLARNAFHPDQPLLILLDDLQWADPLTLAWVAGLQQTPRPGLLVVATCREETGSAAVNALVSTTDTLELTTLDEDAVGEMTADMLALPSAPRGFVGFLTRAARGSGRVTKARVVSPFSRAARRIASAWGV